MDPSSSSKAPPTSLNSPALEHDSDPGAESRLKLVKMIFSRVEDKSIFHRKLRAMGISSEAGGPAAASASNSKSSTNLDLNTSVNGPAPRVTLSKSDLNAAPGIASSSLNFDGDDNGSLGLAETASGAKNSAMPLCTDLNLMSFNARTKPAYRGKTEQIEDETTKIKKRTKKEGGQADVMKYRISIYARAPYKAKFRKVIWNFNPKNGQVLDPSSLQEFVTLPSDPSSSSSSSQIQAGLVPSQTNAVGAFTRKDLGLPDNSDWDSSRFVLPSEEDIKKAYRAYCLKYMRDVKAGRVWGSYGGLERAGLGAAADEDESGDEEEEGAPEFDLNGNPVPAKKRRKVHPKVSKNPSKATTTKTKIKQEQRNEDDVLSLDKPIDPSLLPEQLSAREMIARCGLPVKTVARSGRSAANGCGYGAVFLPYADGAPAIRSLRRRLKGERESGGEFNNYLETQAASGRGHMIWVAHRVGLKRYNYGFNYHPKKNSSDLGGGNTGNIFDITPGLQGFGLTEGDLDPTQTRNDPPTANSYTVNNNLDSASVNNVKTNKLLSKDELLANFRKILEVLSAEELEDLINSMWSENEREDGASGGHCSTNLNGAALKPGAGVKPEPASINGSRLDDPSSKSKLKLSSAQPDDPSNERPSASQKSDRFYDDRLAKLSNKVPGVTLTYCAQHQAMALYSYNKVEGRKAKMFSFFPEKSLRSQVMVALQFRRLMAIGRVAVKKPTANSNSKSGLVVVPKSVSNSSDGPIANGSSNNLNSISTGKDAATSSSANDSFTTSILPPDTPEAQKTLFARLPAPYNEYLNWCTTAFGQDSEWELSAVDQLIIQKETEKLRNAGLFVNPAPEPSIVTKPTPEPSTSAQPNSATNQVNIKKEPKTLTLSSSAKKVKPVDSGCANLNPSQLESSTSNAVKLKIKTEVTVPAATKTAPTSSSGSNGPTSSKTANGNANSGDNSTDPAIDPELKLVFVVCGEVFGKNPDSKFAGASHERALYHKWSKTVKERLSLSSDATNYYINDLADKFAAVRTKILKTYYSSQELLEESEFKSIIEKNLGDGSKIGEAASSSPSKVSQPASQLSRAGFGSASKTVAKSANSKLKESELQVADAGSNVTSAANLNLKLNSKTIANTNSNLKESGQTAAAGSNVTSAPKAIISNCNLNSLKGSEKSAPTPALHNSTTVVTVKPESSDLNSNPNSTTTVVKPGTSTLLSAPQLQLLNARLTALQNEQIPNLQARILTAEREGSFRLNRLKGELEDMEEEVRHIDVALWKRDLKMVPRGSRSAVEEILKELGE